MFVFCTCLLSKLVVKGCLDNKAGYFDNAYHKTDNFDSFKFVYNCWENVLGWRKQDGRQGVNL